MRSLLGSAALIVALVVSGCATMNQDECLTADWYQIGYEDGSYGHSDSRISKHREACAKHGVAPDLRAYQDGHEEGIIRFCTPRNGFVQGKRGYTYSGICPPSLEQEFLDGYHAGRDIYTVTASINSLNSEQSSNEREIHRINSEISVAEQGLFSPETTPEGKRKLYDDIGNMKEQLGSLEQRNRQIIVELAEAQAQLRILEDRYAYY